MIMAMTTAAIETLSEATLRRLREQMGGRRINQTQLSELTGWSLMYISRRLNGKTPFDLHDLEIIEATTGISAAFLLTGHEGERRDPRWVDGALLDGGAPGEFAVRVTPPTPDKHPMRRSTDRILRSVPREPRLSDSAKAYVDLAENSLLPCLGSNQKPSGCRQYAPLSLAS